MLLPCGDIPSIAPNAVDKQEKQKSANTDELPLKQTTPYEQWKQLNIDGLQLVTHQILREVIRNICASVINRGVEAIRLGIALGLYSVNASRQRHLPPRGRRRDWQRFSIAQACFSHHYGMISDSASKHAIHPCVHCVIVSRSLNGVA